VAVKDDEVATPEAIVDLQPPSEELFVTEVDLGVSGFDAKLYTNFDVSYELKEIAIQCLSAVVERSP